MWYTSTMTQEQKQDQRKDQRKEEISQDQSPQKHSSQEQQAQGYFIKIDHTALDLIQRIVRVEEEIKHLKEDMQYLREDMNKRFTMVFTFMTINTVLISTLVTVFGLIQ